MQVDDRITRRGPGATPRIGVVRDAQELRSVLRIEDDDIGSDRIRPRRDDVLAVGRVARTLVARPGHCPRLLGLEVVAEDLGRGPESVPTVLDVEQVLAVRAPGGILMAERRVLREMGLLQLPRLDVEELQEDIAPARIRGIGEQGNRSSIRRQNWLAEPVEPCAAGTREEAVRELLATRPVRMNASTAGC